VRGDQRGKNKNYGGRQPLVGMFGR
jgi:hypothetical protein